MRALIVRISLGTSRHGVVAMDIADWQRLLELPQYIPALAEKAIDWTVLPRLTADDLRDTGIVAVEHRRKLLDAIAAFDRQIALSVAGDLGVGQSYIF